MDVAVQILRVQSKSGTKRIETDQSDTLQRFLEKVMSYCLLREVAAESCLQVIAQFQLRESDSFSLYRNPGLKDELTHHHLPLPLFQIPLRSPVYFDL